jgi:outer membrane protein assembly factor BamB
MLAIAPLWLMLAAANTSAYAQTSDNVSDASVTATPAPSPGDWTQFMRDNMQRWNPYETVLGVGNVGGLQLKWKTPGYYRYVFEPSPAVVNGVVYIGSDGGSVYALNASTGAGLWSYDTGGVVGFASALVGAAAVANGVVYIGSGYNNNNLYALNASTGALLWSYAASGGVSSPAVANGVVYFGSSSGLDGNLYALNASTGALLWSYAAGAGVGSPSVANGVVYADCSDGLCALNANTGALLWSYAGGGDTPAVANGVVYADCSDGLCALNASTGAKLWSFASNGSTEVSDSTPAVANGVVYFNPGDQNLYALNASTGAKLWSYTTGGGTAPAVANGVVYVTALYGNVYALNASTGAKLWSYTTGDFTVSAPTVANGVLYLSAGVSYSGNGHIYAFSLDADLFLRIIPTTTTVHQGDLITYAFPVWNLGPNIADQEVLNTQVPAGTVFDYIRISGTPGLGTCSYTPYLGAGPIPIVCHENSVMALNTTWTVRLTVKVTAPAGTVITESAATMASTPDPNMANNTATVSLTVVP